MIHVVPSRNHPIYLAFRRLRHYEAANLGELKVLHEARKLISDISNHAYPDHPCIEGHMIMMDDLQTMEEESNE